MPAQRDGRLTFARYAFAPNELGYCGGPEDRELLEYAVADEADDGMNRLITRFEAAFPNLKFIAEASGIGDPFDARVVEAYWIGNDLLRSIDPRDFHEYLSVDVGRRIPKRLRKYIVDQVPAGARPHHSFHVFDVSRRTGWLKERIDILDQCRISWGVVERVDGDQISVLYQPVILHEGKLALGAETSRPARRTAEGLGYLGDLQQGDAVSLHWGWICDRLSPQAVAELSAETAHHIKIANRMI